MKIERRVAPFGGLDAAKIVVFDGLDRLLVHRARVAGDAERAVFAEPPCPAGDLADLLRIEVARAAAVEFAQARERDVVDVHVEAHADGVGRHQKLHFARLEQRHLRVARARRQRAHHHRRAAALAANQFGDAVDRLGGEGDDRAARRQARYFLLAFVGQLGKAVARLDLDPGAKAADERGRRR